MNNARVIVVLIVLLLVACSSTEPEVVVVTANPELLPTDTPAPLPTDTPTPLPTRVPTSTATPEIGLTYQHIRDRKLNYCSDMNNDFSIELPPKWVVVAKTCDSAHFEPRTEGAEIEVVIEHLPNYNSNPELAIDELAEDLGEDYTTETLIGHRLDVVVDSTVKTTHQEEPALSQRMTLTAPHHSFYYCDTKEDHLIVLSKSLRTDKKAFFIVGSRCKDDTKHYSDLVRAMKSFQMISP